MNARWLLLMLTASCAAPGWVDAPPRVAGQVVGVGHASTSSAADRRALVHAALALEMHVERIFKDEDAQQDQHVRAQIQAHTERALRKVRIHERWYDSSQQKHWSLVLADRPHPVPRASAPKPAVSPMDASLTLALQRLLGSPRKIQRLTIGAIAFGDARGPTTPLGWFLRERLLGIARAEYQVPTRTRGLYAVAQTTLIEVPSVKIDGFYTETPEAIQLTLSSPGSGRAQARILKAQLPRSLARRPEQLEAFLAQRRLVEALARRARGQAPISIEVDRGEGAAYFVGEKLRLLFKTQARCHLRLFHVSALGGWRQIFPNRFHEEGWVEVDEGLVWPTLEEGFAYEVRAPLGAELIVAVASPRPLALGKVSEDLEQLAEVFGLERGTEIGWTSYTVLGPMLGR